MANLRLQDEIFGDLLPYIQDDAVTDINWNGTDLWVNDQQKGRYKVDGFTLTDKFINQFSQRLGNLMNVSFNKFSQTLEAETDGLRVSVIHESAAVSGRPISIRKTPAIMRITKKSMEDTGYCPDYIINFLENSIKAHMNIVVCGLPGVGKTELLKALTAFIPAHERVITIEDNLEIRYKAINPGKDVVELKVDEDFTYANAIKACLRQLPEWIMLSESRSVEVKYLLESMSTGTHCLTTLHTDTVTKIPDRIKNMISASNRSIENDIYSFLDIGVLVRSYVKPGESITRRIAEICVLDRDGVTDTNTLNMFYAYNEGGLTIERGALPKNIMLKFNSVGIRDPFIKYKWE